MANQVSLLTPAEVYEQFFVPTIFQPGAEDLIENVNPRSGQAALDLACGTGIVARLIAPRVGKQGKVVAVDLRPGALAVARALLPPQGAEIEWLQMDAGALDLPDQAFDLVLCQQGLQFFPDRAAALAHARRVLKPDDRLALSVWQPIERQPVFAALAEVEKRHLVPLGIDEEHIDAPFSLGEAEVLRQLLEETGFAKIEIQPRSFEVRFPSADIFVKHMEFTYGAVIPQFIVNRQAFADFVKTAYAEMRPILKWYRDGDELAFSMHTHVALACQA
jgi:ubiquinone/menaquinone biosynthesis C-methylase UbiE